MTLHEKIARLTADEALAFLVYLADAATRGPLPEAGRADDRSPIAFLFTGWLAAMEHINGRDDPSMTDDEVTALNGVRHAAGDVIVALPARDTDDVWRKVVVALTDDDADPKSQVGRLLTMGRAVLGVAR